MLNILLFKVNSQFNGVEEIEKRGVRFSCF